jgi:hypothetical protein
MSRKRYEPGWGERPRRKPPTHSDASHRVLCVSTAAKGRLCLSPPLATLAGGGELLVACNKRTNTDEKQISAKQISPRHELYAVAADAVAIKTPPRRCRAQQYVRLLALVRRRPLPARSVLSGLRVLLAAPAKAVVVRRTDARARRCRADGQVVAHRLDAWLGRAPAVLKENGRASARSDRIKRALRKGVRCYTPSTVTFKKIGVEFLAKISKLKQKRTSHFLMMKCATFLLRPTSAAFQR